MPAARYRYRLCGNCRYIADRTAGTYECHRDPPEAKRQWPEVRLSDWCGEWSEPEEPDAD